ncbi:MAG TPA: hypothetical protein DDW65_06580 [Firmicutes bacterium]|jgi:uncharacterized protein|nr:hypothetical protein [Bacillota bacterium]
MTREELAGKPKQKLSEIAKSLGIRGTSKLTREDLIEHILLLDPPFSANPEKEKEISQHLNNTLVTTEYLYDEPPLPEHLTGIAMMEVTETEIPSTYNDTKIVLMVRDPYWLHTYWSISQTAVDHISGNFGQWNNVPLTLRVYDITSIHNFDGSNSNYYFDIHVSHGTSNWYIHVGGPNRSFCVDLGFIQENGVFYTITRSNIVTTPRDNVSEIVDEEWMSIEEDFLKLYRLAGAGKANSSAELVESLIKRLEREMGSGAVSSLSSPSRISPRERKFWLVLNTELIVYGATEPDAVVKIQGEAIKLRPDGTFTLRFALPDGTQNIPVVANSADGIDTISITPVVSKQTY